MPDSLPLARQPRSGHSALAPDLKGEKTEAGANTGIPGACHLDTPPRDVGRLLQRHGAQLPGYLDAQRWRDVAAAHGRWPHLWQRRPNLPGDAP